MNTYIDRTKAGYMDTYIDNTKPGILNQVI